MKTSPAHLLLVAASAGLLAHSTRAANYDDVSSDLSNSSPGTNLSSATYGGVDGQLSGPTADPFDYFQLTGLPSGGTLTVSGNWSSSDQNPFLNIVARNSSGVLLSQLASGNNGSFGPTDIAVPAGDLVRFELLGNFEGQSGSITYHLSFSTTEAPLVPEAPTAAAGGVAGLAALLALRRRAKQA